MDPGTPGMTTNQAIAIAFPFITTAIIWSAAVTIDVTDDPTLVREMALAGCTGVFVGFEALTPPRGGGRADRWFGVGGPSVDLAVGLFHRAADRDVAGGRTLATGQRASYRRVRQAEPLQQPTLHLPMQFPSITLSIIPRR